jgi:hypothetical protein
MYSILITLYSSGHRHVGDVAPAVAVVVEPTKKRRVFVPKPSSSMLNHLKPSLEAVVQPL